MNIPIHKENKLCYLIDYVTDEKLDDTHGFTGEIYDTYLCECCNEHKKPPVFVGKKYDDGCMDIYICKDCIEKIQNKFTMLEEKK